MKTPTAENIAETLGLRYDGTMAGMHQFTEIDKTKSSHGASFYVGLVTTLNEVASRQYEKQVQFRYGTAADHVEVL